MPEFVVMVLVYCVGLFAGGMIALKESTVTSSMIESANTVCAINGGLKEIQSGSITCFNGATFERGDK